MNTNEVEWDKFVGQLRQAVPTLPAQLAPGTSLQALCGKDRIRKGMLFAALRLFLAILQRKYWRQSTLSVRRLIGRKSDLLSARSGRVRILSA